MNMRSTLLLAAAVVAVTACAPAAQQGTHRPQSWDAATLQVQNDNWSEVAVYLLRGSMRTRLGTVRSMAKSEFAIPRSFVIGTSDLFVQADPIGSHESYVSPAIMVYPGSRVALKVAHQLRLSNFAVYSSR